MDTATRASKLISPAHRVLAEIIPAEWATVVGRGNIS
jgi:hypothetical protein